MARILSLAPWNRPVLTSASPEILPPTGGAAHADGSSLGLSGALVGAILGLVGAVDRCWPCRCSSMASASPPPPRPMSPSAPARSRCCERPGQSHWALACRHGEVALRLTFAAAGVVGAFAGSMVAKAIDGAQLLELFGALMIVVGIAMFLKRKARAIRRCGSPGRRRVTFFPWLIAGGLGVGLLTVSSGSVEASSSFRP